MHLLCMNESVTAEALGSVMKAKPNVNLIDMEGNSILHYICSNYYLNDEYLQIVMRTGGQINKQNQVL